MFPSFPFPSCLQPLPGVTDRVCVPRNRFTADGRIKVPDVKDKGGNSISVASTSVASRAAVANTGIAALAISDMRP